MFRRFYVLLNGENFKLLIDGNACTVGFWATRYVDAADKQEAVSKAIDRVLNEPQIRVRLNTAHDAPKLTATKVSDAHWFKARLRPPKGFTFYVAEELTLT